MPYGSMPTASPAPTEPEFKRVLYTMEDRKLSRSDL
jgi:hypothetical protein